MRLRTKKMNPALRATSRAQTQSLASCRRLMRCQPWLVAGVTELGEVAAVVEWEPAGPEAASASQAADPSFLGAATVATAVSIPRTRRVPLPSPRIPAVTLFRLTKPPLCVTPCHDC